MNPQYKQRGAFDFRVLSILGIFLIVIVGVAYFFYGLQPVSALARSDVQFSIEKGEGFRSIGARLSQKLLIKSIGVFKLYSLMSGKAQKFQPGTYNLSQSMSVPDIIGELTSRSRNDVLVTIPEGSTLRDIDAILSEAGVIAENEIVSFSFEKLKVDYPFLNETQSLEGFLFPDTYYFNKNSLPETVARRMLDAFMKKAWTLFVGERDWYERLILASFLEKEISEFTDRQIVSGILLKRISLKMPLQVDATISYAKCGGKIKGCDSALVLRSDLSFPSRYNTYERLGWTPTPISNPGESAIKAAITPEDTPYLYYLSAKDTKKTIFSKTLEEHNKNREKYL